MPKRHVSYTDNPDKTFTLVDTDDLIIIKLRKYLSEKELFATFNILTQFKKNLQIVSSFPESASYIYKVTGLLPIQIKNQIKEVINRTSNPNFEYCGNVKKYQENGVYQIYTGNLFLKFRQKTAETFINQILKKYNLTKKIPLKFSENCFFLDTPKTLQKGIFDLSLEILNYPEVEYCHPELVANQKSFISPKCSDIYRQYTGNKNEWVFEKTKIFEAWKYSKGANIKIGIIDDGLDFRVSSFKKKNKIFASKDMHSYEDNRLPQHQNFESHGTAVSSIAVSDDPNAYGVAPEAQLIPIRATSLGSVLQSQAFWWAANNGADIISCSWGPRDSPLFSQQTKNLNYPLPPHTKLAIEYATEKGRNGKGCVVFFAAGNGKERFTNDGYAAHPKVLAIGAVNKQDKTTVYSDYGTPLLCCFPSGDYSKGKGNELIKKPYGVTVLDPLSTDGFSDSNYYEFFDGTSASCPGVAGIAALILSINPELTRVQVKKILESSCKKIGPPGSYLNGYSQEFGHGLIQANLAVQEAFNYSKKNKTMEAASLHIGINRVDLSYYGHYVRPLSGCINDMNNMIQLATSLGYKTSSLSNESATRTKIINQITEIGNKIDTNGIFLITYSGHGAPISNDDGLDFDDGENDESWVAYDGFLLDDEIFNALAKIQHKIKVIVISDSCHSESITKMVSQDDSETRFRGVSGGEVREILRVNSSSIKSIRSQTEPRLQKYEVSVINISACKEDELAREVRSNGVFTQVLLKEFNKIKDSGQSSSDYLTFTEQIARNLTDPSQNPNISFSHNKDKNFIKQFPFSITTENINNQEKHKYNSSENDEIMTPISTEIPNLPKLIPSGKLIINGSLSSSRITKSVNNSAWDDAYNYILEGNPEIEFVEPDMISNIHETTFETDTKSTGDYLDTYPNPEDGESKNPFIWHLDDEHSQLRSANEEVFPEIKTGQRAALTKELVKIAHIDTGVIQGHPSLPINLERGKVFSLFKSDSGAYDLDKYISIAEQQGHGTATVSILAGQWVDYETTNNNYKGFFGAIPYAKVLPIKISETVALLSSRNFSKAVDYAIEQKCDVITMSMAGLPSKVMAKAVNRAYEAGIVMVSAASNSFSKGVGSILPKRTLYPARYDRVISAVGTTFTKKPYLNKYNPPQSKAAGGRYMQTCYGPSSALPTSLAAYTPNITWFNKIEETFAGEIDYYVKSGGGTSSATPQIAAAAALYIQKYRGELDTISKNQLWKKAEIVRQALFLSADKKGYLDIFGNGSLQALELIKNPKYAPNKINISKARIAPEKRYWFGGVFNLFSSRSVSSISKSTEEQLEDMLISEINQIVYLDDTLTEYQDIDFESSERIDISSNPEFLNKIILSPHSSEFLKKTLTSTFNINSRTLLNSKSSGGFLDYNSERIKSSLADVIINNSNGITIENVNCYKDGFGENAYFIDEFEVNIDLNSTRSGASSEITIFLKEKVQKSIHSAALIEEVFEGEIIYRWDLGIKKNSTSKSLKTNNNYSSNTYCIKALGEESNGRGNGIFRKLKVKLFKWLIPKIVGKFKIQTLAKPLGDSKYDIIIYDLNQKATLSKTGWCNIDSLNKEQIISDIQKSNKKVLLMFPGLFSSVEKGFDEFLSSANNRSKLLLRHSNYIIGFNQPTLFHGIEKNADEITELTKSIGLVNKDCNVMARSRGGLLARSLFENHWNNNNSPFNLNKLVMCGTPNQGTMIASNKNWESLFTIAINVSKLSLGVVAPVVPKILSAIKAIGIGVTQMPGIDDQEEGSAFITKLNSKSINTDKYFVFTSNYEPRKFLKKLFNELLVDRAIFKGEYNDSVAPLPGALFQNKDYPTTISLSPDQYFISGTNDEVSHFGYFDPKHSEINEKLLGKELKSKSYLI